MSIFAVLLLSPLLVALGAAFRAGTLFLPVMVLLHYVHDIFTWVPALGGLQTFLVLMLVWLVVPIDSGSKS